jgi:hypothetical protein
MQTIISKSPVELAVEPLKADAVGYAATTTMKAIEKVLKELASFGGDAEKYAPYPRDTRISRNEYLAQKAKHDFVARITKSADGAATRRWNAPDLRIASPEAIAREVEMAKEDAALQYDTFVAKLNSKIGACDTASLYGSHVWGSSVLTVTKGTETEYWKTQQIVNTSKLGRMFLQWPSRKVKTAHT